MKLQRIRLVNLGPFEDLTFDFSGENDEIRPVTVVFGGGGVGKTTLLAAIASTRPGYAVAITRGPGHPPRGFAVADWVLGDDDPDRPHPLCVASPQASHDETEETARLRRREQVLFDRRAAEAGGFLLVCLSATRWFSSTPVGLSAPNRTVLRHDHRAPAHFDDATRADLARETKQVMVYAAIASHLPEPGVGRPATVVVVLEEAIRDFVNRLLRLTPFRYVGVDPFAFEPLFAREQGDMVPFDGLPTSVRHLIAIGVLAIRGLFAAYPGRDPRMTEGVVVVDEIALHQDVATVRGLIPILRGALPRVQWILTTSSPELSAACDPTDVITLRRMPASRRVELFDGPSATLH